MDQIAKKRIMIVGRDSHLLYLLQRFVRTNAYRPIPVNLADDVLFLAKDKKPVAIVLEVDTPEVVGWKAFHALKSDPDAGGIPVARARLEQAERNGTRVKTREYQGAARLHTRTVEEMARDEARARANADAADKGKMTKNS
jgi:CheY-like chemotaxis protein